MYQTFITLITLLSVNFYHDKTNNLYTTNIPTDSNIIRGRNLELELPKGYVQDGSVDYTQYIQNAINKYSILTFPNFPILINEDGLNIVSNRDLYFLKSSLLIMKGNNKPGYKVLQLKNVTNVNIFNPAIKGDRKIHIGNEGEWGMGIGIYSSQNIKIDGADITQCWGDGIYIGKSSNNLPCRNISISNSIVKYNRRNGISIISVDGLKLKNIYSGYSNGALPMCGIDIEPNNPHDVIKNIEVINSITENNGGSGISIGLNKLFGKTDNVINIDIKDHVDTGSEFGLLISCHKKMSKNNTKILGTINVENSNWNNNFVSRYKLTSFDQPTLKLTMTNTNK